RARPHRHPMRETAIASPPIARATVRSLSAAAVLGLAACASAPPPAPGPTAPTPEPRQLADRGTVSRAVANLFSASGSLVSGRVVLTPVEGGMRIRGEVG